MTYPVAADQQFNTVLLIAPIFGLSGIIVGWWLNWLAENRRRQWQTEDSESQWNRERAAERQRWIRDQLVEAYLTFLNTAHVLDNQVIFRITSKFDDEQMVEEGEKLQRLYERLQQESEVLFLFCEQDTREVAAKIRTSALDVVSAAMEGGGRKELDPHFREFRQDLREFTRRARTELGIEARR